MGTDKRARQKANRQAKMEAQEAEAKSENFERRTRRIGVWVAIAAVIIGIIVLFSVLGGDDEGANTITFGPTPAADDAEDAAPAVVELASEVPADFEPFAGTGALAAVEPAARNNAYSEAPELTIDTDTTYVAVLDTDAGTIRLELFADEAPLAVNNFVNLARDGFYDGLTFHRVIEGFMAQGGDPAGTGAGGPGYEFADEVDTGRVFDGPGILAMANAGPATNGSQFFITFDATEHLNGLHTIFGQLSGDEVSQTALGNIGITDNGATPTVINSIRIVEL